MGEGRLGGKGEEERERERREREREVGNRAGKEPIGGEESETAVYAW